MEQLCHQNLRLPSIFQYFQEILMNALSTRLATQDDVAVVALLFDAYRQFYEQDADLPLATKFI
jgi:hypothetical protein